MKKFSKALISVLLSVTVIATACALTGVISGAQATAKGVSIAFVGADNDWATVSGTTIKDSALAVTVYNDSESDIIVSNIATNGTKITYSGWTSGMTITAGQLSKIGIAGTTTAESVLTVTVTYRVKGNPTSTSETCTAYIFCSAQAYTSITSLAAINSGLFRYGVDTEETISPVSTATVKYDDSDTGTYHRYANNTADIYVDGSKYKTWADFNLMFDFYNGTVRDHAYFSKITLTQTSSTGSFSLGGAGTDGTTKTVTSEYNKDTNPDGFFMQAGQEQTISTAFAGTIPTEASSKLTMQMVGYGQTGGIVAGVGAAKTSSLEPKWTITIYNNNKSALRERLMEIANMGLNKASYKSGWDSYETALKNAYTVLGTIKKTAANVSSALSSLNSAYKALVRYAVVITNQNYYQGNDNTNPVLLDHTYDMKVTNNAVYNPSVLTSGQYPDYPFNRSSLVTEKVINVNDTTNYTEVINQYYWNVDTTALEAAIAEQASWKHIDEDNNDMYTTDSWQAYSEAAVAATRVLNDQTLFQTDIDAATKALTNARDSLKRLDIDTEWLDEGIQWSENIIYNAYDDDQGYGWDTTELFGSAYAQTLYSNLLTAHNEATEVTNDPQFTKSQADKVCKQLWDAIYALRVKDDTTKGLFLSGNIRHADIDKYGYFKSLTDSLQEDTGLRVVFNDVIDNTSGEYRLNESSFTEESWANLQDALYGDFVQGNYCLASTQTPYAVDDSVGEISVPAYSMINNIWFLASQADYNGCRDNILNYVNNLEYVINAADLSAVLEQAQAIDKTLYTEASYNALKEDITFVEALIEKIADPQLYGDADAIKQADIDTAKTALEDTLTALVPIPHLDVVNTELVNENGIIYGETLNKTAEEVKADFEIKNGSDATMIIYNTKGVEISDSARVGTGYTIVASMDGVEYGNYTFVVMGDVNGTASINDDDFMATYNYFFSQDGLTGVYLKAADLNKDGVVDLCDAVMIKDLVG